jgi:ADP-ribosylglycohydrolase
MRIAPVGVAFPVLPLDGLVDAVEQASRVTHNTGIAIAGAAAGRRATGVALSRAGTLLLRWAATRSTDRRTRS